MPAVDFGCRCSGADRHQRAGPFTRARPGERESEHDISQEKHPAQPDEPVPRGVHEESLVQVCGELQPADVPVVVIPGALAQHRTLAVDPQHIGGTTRVGHEHIEPAGQTAACVNRLDGLARVRGLQVLEESAEPHGVQMALRPRDRPIVQLPVEDQERSRHRLHEPQRRHREAQVPVKEP